MIGGLMTFQPFRVISFDWDDKFFYRKMILSRGVNLTNVCAQSHAHTQTHCEHLNQFIITINYSKYSKIYIHYYWVGESTSIHIRFFLSRLIWPFDFSRAIHFTITNIFLCGAVTKCKRSHFADLIPNYLVTVNNLLHKFQIICM